MSDKETKRSFKLLDKLKNVKHIEIYIAIIFVVIMLLIYFSNNSSDKKSGTTQNITNELTVTAYVENMETNLEDILSNIGGVTNVKVMITLDMNNAEITDSKINLNTFPGIKGVLVTANGLSNTSLKLKVLQALQAVIDITNGNVEILSSD